ncbi:hypothetical protein [Clostridium sp.]|uniref:hypothetical protein n=1 Tax=Clostridium sp. TaxID=1506 RepID=UPI002FCA5AC0
MNKKVQKGLVAAVAATMGASVVAPVVQAATLTLAQQYEAAYKAYEKAAASKDQKDLTAARGLLEDLYKTVKGTKEEYLATTLSSILDPVQQEKFEFIIAVAKTEAAKVEQKNINTAKYNFNNLSASWKVAFNAYSSAIDTVQQAYAVHVLDMVKAAKTEAELNVAKAKFADLMTIDFSAEAKASYEAAIKPEIAKAEATLVVVKVDSIVGAGAKKLEVKFNKAVVDTTKMVLTVKRDNINVSIASVEWNADKTVATLTTSTNLQTGDYVATAKYAAEAATTTPEVEIQAAKVGKITFASEAAVITDKSVAAGDEKQAVTVKVKVENQYGEDITKSLDTADLTGVASPLSVSSSVGTAVSLTNGVLRLENTSDYTVDQNVVITIVHKGTATVSTGTVKVAQAANIASLTLGELTTDDSTLKGKTVYQSTMTANASKYYLPLTALDQYGNELTAADLAGVTIVSSNTSIVNPNGLTTKNNKPAIAIQAQAGTPTYGTAVITVVSASGKSVSMNVVVKENAKIDVLQVEQPAVTLKATEKAVVPFTAVDQYGNALVSSTQLGGITLNGTNTTATFGKGGSISITGGTLSTKIDYVNDNKQILEVTPTTKGTPVVVTVISATGKVQTQSWAVEAAPVVTTIAGLDTDFYTAMQQGQTSDIAGLILANDQYGDEVSLGANYEIAYADTTIALADRNVTFAGTVFTAHATNAGTESFTIKLYDKALGDATKKVIDEYTFTMESVDLEDVSEFAIADLDKHYVGTTAAVAYDQVVEVYGIKDGKDVKVNQGLIKNVSNNAGLAVAGTTLRSTDLSASLTAGDKTGTLTVLVEGANGPISLTKEITYSEDAPKAASVAIKKVTGGVANTVTDPVISLAKADVADILTTDKGNFYFSLLDQYNVASTDVTFTITNVVDADEVGGALTVTNATNDKILVADADGTAGDSFVINAITSSGLAKTIKVVLND